jgi:hypothetical protein
MRTRIVAGAFAGLMLVLACLPVIEQLGLGGRYHLDAARLQLVGKTDTSLTKQLTYDASNRAYIFNKDVITNATETGAGAAAALQKAAVGAKDKSNTKTYALNVPEDFSQGVTYYDANSNLSFKLVPQFSAMQARTEQGHLVFPLSGGRQAVYTLKNNGLKEDILLPAPTRDTEVYTYTFNLPKTLAIRVVPNSNGAIGIYSADPALYGNISYAADTDRAKVEKARENAEKTNLVFALPAPVVTTASGKGVGKATARFELNGNELKVVAENLLSAGNQPLSIDPSVVVTSTSDFEYGGNNEGDIDFSTAGQVTRGALTGGDIGTWASTSTISYISEAPQYAFYNNYLYILGGQERTVATYKYVSYAHVNSDGSLGSWTSSPNQLPKITVWGGAVAYNGYLYSLGGTRNGAVGAQNYYARINSDGSIGGWTETTALPVVNGDFGYAASNGYVYVLGGSTVGTVYSDVYYARLLPSGDIGAWTATTSLSYQRNRLTANIYNGYIYIFGGSNATPAFVSDVQYAKINADGTLGSWMTTNSFSGARYGHISAFYNGYAYLYGGWTGSYPTTVQYAQVNANGTLSTWITSVNNFTNGHTYVAGGVYKGYLYMGMGWSGSTDYSDFQYAKIEPQGKTVVVKNSGNPFGTPARRYVQTVAAYGQLYTIGGDTGSAASTAIGRQPINADGTLGNYTTGNVTQMTTPGARMLFGAFVYDGYMYILGGCKSALSSCDTSGNALNTVYSALMTPTTGAVGTWTAQTSFSTARYGFATAVLNGYIYVIGGTANGGGSPMNSIEYASFDYTAGTVGAWTTASSTYNLPTGLTNMAYATSGNSVYLAGGCTAGTAASCSTWTNAVSHIQLLGSGGLASTWSTDTSFTTARYGAAMTVVNGVLYLAGGYDGTSYYSDIQYALIGANGAVGTWQTSNPISTTAGVVTAIMGAGMTAQNGVFYIVGGYNGSYQTAIYYATANNGGRGQAGTWVTNGTDLSGIYTNGVGYSRSVALNGYIYLIGGATPAALSTVSYAALNADGSVGTWATTSSLQVSRLQAAAVTYNGYIYTVGGQTAGAGKLSSVEYAKVNSDGTLGAWTYTSSLNSIWGGLSGLDVAIYKGYIYATGGIDSSSTVQNAVQYARINPNGTLGTWTATTLFTTAREYHSTIAINGYLYVMAGFAGAGNYFADAQMAPINSDGTVGSWTYTSPLPIAGARMIAIPYNGFLYLYGGNTNTGAVPVGTNVWYAPINADGSIGDWQMTIGSTFTTARAGTTGAIYNGYMYLLGGGTTPFMSDVQYAPINVMARKGQYSTVITMNAKTISNISFNGLLPGLGSVAYTAYSANGTVVASGRSSDGINIIGSACAATVSSAAYLFISVTLDDTSNGGAVFADASSTSVANITDITIDYQPGHPSPFIRLRHGQTLQVGALSPLDTCVSP